MLPYQRWFKIKIKTQSHVIMPVTRLKDRCVVVEVEPGKFKVTNLKDIFRSKYTERGQYADLPHFKVILYDIGDEKSPSSDQFIKGVTKDVGTVVDELSEATPEKTLTLEDIQAALLNNPLYETTYGVDMIENKI